MITDAEHRRWNAAAARAAARYRGALHAELDGVELSTEERRMLACLSWTIGPETKHLVTLFRKLRTSMQEGL